MKRLESIEATEALIEENQLVFLYISQENCSVCHALKPKVTDVLDRYPKIIQAEIKVDDVPAVAGRFNVFTAPVLLLFVDGKEYHRDARSVYMQQFGDKVKELYDNYFNQ